LEFNKFADLVCNLLNLSHAQSALTVVQRGGGRSRWGWGR